jgi:hypothetical protein
MVAMKSPNSPEMSVLTMRSSSMLVRTLRPRHATANSSEGPKRSPNSESWRDTKSIASAETMPPTAEETSTTSMARPLSPLTARG